MKKNIMLIALILAFGISSNAQSHDYKPGCRFYKRPSNVQGSVVSDLTVCPACEKINEEEKQGRIREDKRRADKAAADEQARLDKIKADKEAADAKARREEEARRKREALQKELDEFLRDQQRYVDKQKVNISGSYAGYDAGRASQKIPARTKALKVVGNNFTKEYEIYSGEELVKTYSMARYSVRSLNTILPYLVLWDNDRKLNKFSLLDGTGEPVAVAGEKYFQDISFTKENNTIRFSVAKNDPKKMYSGSTGDGLSGVYNSEDMVRQLINIIEQDKQRRRALPDEVDARGIRTVRISGFGVDYFGYEGRVIVSGLDLSILDAKSVFIIP